MKNPNRTVVFDATFCTLEQREAIAEYAISRLGSGISAAERECVLRLVWSDLGQDAEGWGTLDSWCRGFKKVDVRLEEERRRFGVAELNTESAAGDFGDEDEEGFDFSSEPAAPESGLAGEDFVLGERGEAFVRQLELEAGGGGTGAILSSPAPGGDCGTVWKAPAGADSGSVLSVKMEAGEEVLRALLACVEPELLQPQDGWGFMGLQKKHVPEGCEVVCFAGPGGMVFEGKEVFWKRGAIALKNRESGEWVWLCLEAKKKAIKSPDREIWMRGRRYVRTGACRRLIYVLWGPVPDRVRTGKPGRPGLGKSEVNLQRIGMRTVALVRKSMGDKMGISQAGLAKKLGLSRALMCHYEKRVREVMR